MNGARRISGPAMTLAFCQALLGAVPAEAQIFPPGGAFGLSETVNLDEATSQARTHLAQVAAYQADGRFEEAIESLLQVVEQEGGKVLRLAPGRFVSLREFAHRQFATLPPEALALYRRRVDPQARRWYEEGLAQRREDLLWNVADQFFASSYGDDALYLLAEMALERGDFGSAWSLALPLLPATEKEPLTRGLVYPRVTREPSAGAAHTAGASDVPVADVRARLTLTSILAGEWDRAERELAEFRAAFPGASGPLAGRTVVYATGLAELLAEARIWPPRRREANWESFAGSVSRNRSLPESVDPAAVRWRVKLPDAPAADPTVQSRYLRVQRPIADNFSRPASYHPLLVGEQVLVNTQDQVFSYELRAEEAGGRLLWSWGRETTPVDRPGYARRSALGVARFTMTARGERLFARMGSVVTGWPAHEEGDRPLSYLICLDLAREGKLVYRVEAEEGWAFDGSPVCDGVNLYAAMRRNDVQPQAHVAAFDAETGRLRWRRLICAAESPARGAVQERTHNLLTLHGQTLYFNTQLGAVAAISTRGGHVKWISLYERAQLADPGATANHFFRDLTPCLYHHGKLLVAPADSPFLFAFDAESGAPLWRTARELDDVVHLLGASGKYLICGGDRLYWIDLDREGAIAHQWPIGPDPKGYGRGLLAGDEVLWPTQDSIYRFAVRPPGTGPIAPRGDPIRLTGRDGDEPVTGGNLLVGGGRLLIATGNRVGGNELIVIGQEPRPRLPGEREVTRRPAATGP